MTKKKSDPSTDVSNNTGNKTYILDLRNGDIRKVTVPANWKLTFGPTIPYAGKYTGSPEGTALRFYEGNKENLRACFTDVKAFRDAAIPVLEKRTQVQHQVLQKHTKAGMKNVEVAASVTEWVNPDEIDEETEGKDNPFLALLNQTSGDEEKSDFLSPALAPVPGSIFQASINKQNRKG